MIETPSHISQVFDLIGRRVTHADHAGKVFTIQGAIPSDDGKSWVIQGRVFEGGVWTEVNDTADRFFEYKDA